jgi:hypothetical protein
LLWFAARGWAPSYGKALYINLLAFGLAVMGRAIATAHDGPPHLYAAAAQSLVPHLVALLVFLLWAHWHTRRDLPYPQLTDPQVLLRLNEPDYVDPIRRYRTR